jgi:hypothetical protein
MSASVHCESCKFFEAHKSNSGDARSAQGLCRFNPPVSQPGPDARGLWPVVANSDWCGHYSIEMTPAE